MATALRKNWLIFVLGFALVSVITLNIRSYGWNVSSLLHMDHTLGDRISLPRNVVVLDVPSYDGAQYYQVARNIPRILLPSSWSELGSEYPGAYAYQRFLLPLAGFILALGSDTALPWTLLLINVASLLGISAFMLRKNIPPLFIAALCLSPAAMVALHFSLAEPLTLLLITTVLLRYKENERLRPLDIVLLSLVTLAREVNVLFILFFIGFSILKKNWKDAFFLLIPVATFIGWHSVIYGIFGAVPFLLSADKRGIPGQAPIELLTGHYGYNHYTASSIALLLFLVLPAILWVLSEIHKKRRMDILPLGALAFLLLMLSMPDHIWGSITSIGRVITPTYPLLLLFCAERKTGMAKYLATACLMIGIATAVGLALSIHPYTVS